MYISYDTIKLTIIGSLCILSIIIYGTFRCKTSTFVDPLTKSYFPEPLNQFLDGWGILHFLFFMAISYMYPTHLLFIFVMGILWEIIESIFHEHPFYISKCSYNLATDQVAGWWYGRWQDIIMNTLGMILGYNLSMWK